MFTLIYFILVNSLTLLFYSLTFYSLKGSTNICNKEYSLFLTTFILSIIKIGIGLLLFLLLKRIKKNIKLFKTILLSILIIVNIINTTIIFIHFDKYYNTILGSCILSKTDEILYIFSNFLTISSDALLIYSAIYQMQPQSKFIQMV